jgi:NADH dehydrogenase
VLERELRELGVSYAIVRPTVIFGREDILINNVAWLLRRLPVFVAPGGGDYRLQPVYVDDLAGLMAETGAGSEDVAFDAVGPEDYGFVDLVAVVRDAVGSPARIVTVPRELALGLSRVVGRVVGDVVLTRDELEGLRANLLVSSEPPAAPTSFRDWVDAHGDELGRRYASELRRHYRR